MYTHTHTHTLYTHNAGIHAHSALRSKTLQTASCKHAYCCIIHSFQSLENMLSWTWQTCKTTSREKGDLQGQRKSLSTNVEFWESPPWSLVDKPKHKPIKATGSLSTRDKINNTISSVNSEWQLITGFSPIPNKHQTTKHQHYVNIMTWVQNWSCVRRNFCGVCMFSPCWGWFPLGLPQ